MSVKFIVVSHGRFSEGIVDSVQMLTGQQEDLVYYGLFPEQTTDVLREKLEEEIKNTPEDVEILFLSDIFHGSPFNAIVDLTRNYKFYHFTGINLGLMIVAVMDRMLGKGAEEICRNLLVELPGTVMYVNDMLEASDDDDEDEEE